MSNYFFITNRKWDEEKLIYNLPNDTFDYGSIDQSDNSFTKFKSKDDLLHDLANFESCLIYIHGFNNSFQGALDHFSVYPKEDQKRAYILFGWPSQDPAEYLSDKKIAIQSAILFSTFLEELCTILPENVNIMCHSMGGYCFWKSFKSLGKVKLGKVFLVACDMKKERLEKRIKSGMTEKITDIVNYSFKNDLALFWSRFVSSGCQKIGTTTVNGVKNIRVSEKIVKIDKKWNHTYFHHKKVLFDILEQLETNKSPEERGLIHRKDKKAWILSE